MVKNLTNKKGTTVLSSYAYTYYLDGNQKSKTDRANKTTNYLYDGAGRLLKESESGTDGLTKTYTYDMRSNRANMGVTGADSYSVAYTYDISDRLLKDVKTAAQQDSIADYGYDANGNRTPSACPGLHQLIQRRKQRFHPVTVLVWQKSTTTTA